MPRQNGERVLAASAGSAADPQRGQANSVWGSFSFSKSQGLFKQGGLCVETFVGRFGRRERCRTFGFRGLRWVCVPQL